MENSVLGNALEGVPEESEEEEQPKSTNIESADNLDGLYIKLISAFFCGRKLKTNHWIFMSPKLIQPPNPKYRGIFYLKTCVLNN